MSLTILDEVIEDGEVHFRASREKLVHRFVLTKPAITKLSQNKNLNFNNQSDVLKLFKEPQLEVARAAESLLVKQDLAYDPVYTITASMVTIK